MEKKGLGVWWIILIVVLALAVILFFVFAVIAYFGVFNPGEFKTSQGGLPDSVALSVPFSADSLSVKTTGIELDIRNGGTESFTINSIQISNCGSSNNLALTVASGGVKKASVDCALAKGSKFRGNLEITYTKQGSSQVFVSAGTIMSNVAS